MNKPLIEGISGSKIGINKSLIYIIAAISVVAGAGKKCWHPGRHSNINDDTDIKILSI
jgi:hypothetical protein